MNRRDFMKFLGMASSASVLASCGVEKSTEKIIPLLVPPTDPDYLPGEPMFRNTICTECNAGCGVTARMVDFNVIKLDGIEGHPVNDGALCMRGQASLMRLYHPQRLKTPMLRKRNATEMERLEGNDFEQISWAKAYEMILDVLKKARENGRENVLLSGEVSGSVADLMENFSNTNGVTQLPAYEPYAHANLRAAYNAVFGRKEIPAFKIEAADFLVTVGADILETFVNPVSQSAQLERARVNNHLKWMHLEPHASMTGFKADENLKVSPGSEGHLLAYLLGAIVESKIIKNRLPAAIAENLPQVSKAKAAEQTGLSQEILETLTTSLVNARNPLLIVGGVATEQSNGLAGGTLRARIHWTTAMTNSTVDFSAASMSGNIGTMKDLANLTQQLNQNKIGVMLVANTDPVGTAPTSLGLGDAMNNATFRIAIADFLTDTAKSCELILPLSHSLESWGDVQLRGDVTGFMKPVLKEKLFDTRSVGEILFELTRLSTNGENGETYDQWVQNRWAERFGENSVENVVTAGYYQSSNNGVKVSLQSNSTTAVLAGIDIGKAVSGAVAYVVPSVRTFDGRSAILPLSYEIPDPLTTISYGEWISLSKENAEALGLQEASLVHKTREVVSVEANGASRKLANFVQPGLPKDVFTIQRDQVSRAMLTFDKETGECLARLDNVALTATGERRSLSIQAGALEQGKRNITREEHKHEIGWLKGDETLYPDPNDRYETYRWSISIDMESCVGCSACVAACYVENNIPVVGEEEHLMGREMSWIRVQPYYFEDGTMDSLIMMCQQCDFAPCENVCPVYATYHNEEGLNVMVYNRCVGTRYCHNNCPYKVRRFNWFDWTDRGAWEEPMSRMTNPDIWVRPKGVMEKCTFCIQRIRRAKDHAKDEGRIVHDGEIATACQQACPTDAITFGNLLDKQSEVYKKSQSNRQFRVLEELGTGPAVHYLRKEEEA